MVPSRIAAGLVLLASAVAEIKPVVALVVILAQPGV
jgi:hypothetical protein